MEMILTGDAISAEEAKECGLISKLVKHEDLMDEAHATAAVIAANSKLTAQMCKVFHMLLHQQIKAHLKS